MLNARATSEAGVQCVALKLLSMGARIYLKKAGNKTTIVASRIDGSGTFYISTRARSTGDWQTSIKYGSIASAQHDDNSFWVFVDLSRESPCFYIVQEKWIAKDIFDTHQACLAKHGGKRSRNDSSLHHAIALDRIHQWRDRWDQLGIE